MQRVLTIGTATRDVFLRSPAIREIADPHFTAHAGFPTGKAECFPLGAKLDIESITLTTGGGATNAAVTFARQGKHTRCLAAAGKDPSGDDIVRELKAEKVTPHILRSKDLGTGYSTLLLTGRGERTVLVYRGAANDLSARTLPLAKLSADWVYIAPGNIPFSAISKAVSYFHKKGARIAMNPSSHYLKLGAKVLRPLLDTLDVIIMNREEASYLTGVSYDNEAKMFEALREMIRSVAVMTEGPKGVLVCDGEYIYRAGTYREKRVADRTGAGDAFGSGFVAGLMRGKKTSRKARDAAPFSRQAIEYAIRLGSANATSVVEHIGAKEGILTKSQFERQKRWKRLTIRVNRA